MINLQNAIIIINKLFKGTLMTFIIESITRLNNLNTNTITVFLITVIVTPLLWNNLAFIFVFGNLYKITINYTPFIKAFYSGFFKIHPMLFYIIIVVLPVINNLPLLQFKGTKTSLLTTTIFTLILGSYWAIHQTSWGDYWSNDSIELILLFLLIIANESIHKVIIKNLNKTLSFFLVILAILYTRHGLVYTKHNFFNFNSTFVTLVKINVTAIFVTYLTLYCLKINKHKFVINLVVKHLYTIVLFICIIKNSLSIIIIKNFVTSITLFFISVILMLTWKNINKKLFHIIVFLVLLLYNLNFIKTYYQILLQNILILFFNEKIISYLAPNHIILKKFVNYQNNSNLLKNLSLSLNIKDIKRFTINLVN